jgi:GTP cyclohydrolase I
MTMTSNVNGVAWTEACRGVSALLRHCGYEPTSDGLVDTPARVVRAWRELTAGTTVDPAQYLARTFDGNGMDVDEMIALRRIGFVSVCEHHILPFTGYASVAYVPSPGAAVVGVSKLARVVTTYAQRLQVQERLTSQIANCIQTHLDTAGVAVCIEATHSCLTLRGVRSSSAVMVTSKLLGVFRTDPAARAEFFELARGAPPIPGGTL